MIPVRRAARAFDGELGFTVIELLVATFTGMIVLGLGVALVSQVQRGYARQLDSASVHEEARFAIDWIARELMSAGSNPYEITVSECPTTGTSFAARRFDPDQNGSNDDLRINADAGIPNGLLGGDSAGCNEAGEDITIAFDPINQTITRRDHNVDPAPVPMTDAVITDLEFTYLDADGLETTDPAAVTFVQVDVNARSGVMNPQTGGFDAFATRTEVHLRTR